MLNLQHFSLENLAVFGLLKNLTRGVFFLLRLWVNGNRVPCAIFVSLSFIRYSLAIRILLGVLFFVGIPNLFLERTKSRLAHQLLVACHS